MYRIGELARTTGISKRTIDYYTQIGLLEPQRTDSNYRMYSENTPHVLQLIEHYKTLNMPLNEIKAAIELVKSEKSVDMGRLERHLEKILEIMQHLEVEINGINPLLAKLNGNQKELITNVSTRGLTLAQKLQILFGEVTVCKKDS